MSTIKYSDDKCGRPSSWLMRYDNILSLLSFLTSYIWNANMSFKIFFFSFSFLFSSSLSLKYKNCAIQNDLSCNIFELSIFLPVGRSTDDDNINGKQKISELSIFRRRNKKSFLFLGQVPCLIFFYDENCSAPLYSHFYAICRYKNRYRHIMRKGMKKDWKYVLFFMWQKEKQPTKMATSYTFKQLLSVESSV